MAEDKGRRAANAPLEDLPAEIRRQLLLSVHFDELRALVHASPVFHEQYRLDRRSILLGCLEQALGSAVIEGCAVDQAMAITAEIEDGREKAEALARFDDTYRARCAPAPYYPMVTARVTEAQAASMTALYLSVIKPIARSYADWALARLASVKMETDYKPDPLSKTEEIRILRALYRFQLCCSLFAEPKHEPKKGWGWSHAATGGIPEWLETMEPWEVEELISIYDFVEDKYMGVFAAIKDNVGLDDFDYMKMKDIVSHGLRLLHMVLFETSSQNLVAIIQDWRRCPKTYSLSDGYWGQSAQHSRPKRHVTERHLKSQRRDPLPFRGDGEPDAEGTRPPLAWTIIWKGTYSSKYGEYIPFDTHGWAYVMWDAARIGATGLRELLLEDFKGQLGEHDPRDETYEYDEKEPEDHAWL